MNRQNPYQSTLIDKWLGQMNEDKEIDEYRGQKWAKTNVQNQSHNKIIEINSLNQKLNRLQRTFLRQTDTKKQQKSVSTVNQSFLELDSIYKKVSLILANLKESQKHNGKQISNQIVSLYNRSVSQLSKRQKLEKEIKNKKSKLDQLEETKNLLEQDNLNSEKEFLQTQAEHWLKQQLFEKKN